MRNLKKLNKEDIRKSLNASPSRPLDTRGDDDLNPGMAAPEQLTKAAVLVGLVARKNGLTVMLTERADHLSHHPGQISFPGGRVEPHDASFEATALRETSEEIGLDECHIEILGRLDLYNTRTGFQIIPVVGLITPPFELTRDADEVADIFEVPLNFFLNADNHQRQSRQFKGALREFYAMPYQDRYIWGATAGMIVNLYDVLITDQTLTRKAI